MKTRLNEFLELVPDFDEIKKKHTRVVAYFGYFLTAVLGEQSVRPTRIEDCYEAAALDKPVNIHDTMRKSRAFVRTSTGLQLQRDVHSQIAASLRGTQKSAASISVQSSDDLRGKKNKNVVVIHGRDLRIRDSMFQFLLSLRLNPIEWEVAVKRTGKGTPYTGEVVEALFVDAQAIVVLFTPDEKVELRKDLRNHEKDSEEGWQSRPNVFLEAGMALVKEPNRTVLVEVGNVRQASDLLGLNMVRLDDTPRKRDSLV